MSKSFPLRVNGARAIIQLDPPESKTIGGIIIPGAEEEVSNKGTVVAVGDGQRLDNGTTYPMTVEVGNKVIFNSNQGAPVPVEGHSNEYIVINEVHILAIMD